MKIYTSPTMMFEENERRMLLSALSPYQAVVDDTQHKEFEHLIQKVESPHTCWDLLALHRCLGDLQEALSEDVSFWESEAKKAQEAPAGILANPREAYTVLAATRKNQVDLARQSLAMAMKALGILETWKKEIQQISKPFLNHYLAPRSSDL